MVPSLKILSILSLPLTIYSFVHNSRTFLVRESTTTIVNGKNSNIPHQYDFIPTCSRNTSNKSVQLSSSTSPPDIPAPTFDGKMVFPMRAILGGLQPHKVCATFAIMDSGYKRGDNSWGQCSLVGTTYDLYSTLMELKEEHGAEKVSHVRVISFQIPNKEAMEKQASEWFGLSEKATEGSTLFYSPVIENENEFKNEEERERISLEEQKEKLARALDATAYLFEEGDDYDYDDDNDNLESPEADTIVSPFEEEKSESSDTSLDAKKELEFNVENVDKVRNHNRLFKKFTLHTKSILKNSLAFVVIYLKVLDEVRPYLISDGGNVSVHSVDESTGNGKKNMGYPNMSYCICIIFNILFISSLCT